MNLDDNFKSAADRATKLPKRLQMTFFCNFMPYTNKAMKGTSQAIGLVLLILRAVQSLMHGTK